jgi:hypothetical protein
MRTFLPITNAELTVLKDGTTSAAWKDEAGKLIAHGTYNSQTGKWVSCWIGDTHKHNIPDFLPGKGA